MNHGSVIDVLLQRKANSEVQTTHGYTSIHLAAIYDRPKALQSLILPDNSHQADTEARVQERNAYYSFESEWKGMTALEIAIRQKHTEIIEILLSGGANPVSPLSTDNEFGSCPVHLAFHELWGSQAQETFKMLYQAGIAHSKDRYEFQGSTLLELLVTKGQAKMDWILQSLLDLGVKDPFDGQKTPRALSQAIQHGKHTLVSTLIKQPGLYDQRSEVLKLAFKEATPLVRKRGKIIFAEHDQHIKFIVEDIEDVMRKEIENIEDFMEKKNLI